MNLHVLIQYLMRSPIQKNMLGRWGYHWESKLKYQKYYD